jgi:hypothetical protein
MQAKNISGITKNYKCFFLYLFNLFSMEKCKNKNGFVIFILSIGVMADSRLQYIGIQGRTGSPNFGGIFFSRGPEQKKKAAKTKLLT